MDPAISIYPMLSGFTFSANSPLIFTDPSGELITFADPALENWFWSEYYTSMDDEYKQRIQTLNSSNVEYHISSGATEFGYVARSYYDFKGDRFEIFLPKHKKAEFDILVTGLGDELQHAYQFEKGKIGFVDLGRGSSSVIAYDLDDEVDSQIGAVSALESYMASKGVDLNSKESQKEYLQGIDPKGRNQSIGSTINFRKYVLRDGLEPSRYLADPNYFQFPYNEKLFSGTLGSFEIGRETFPDQLGLEVGEPFEVFDGVRNTKDLRLIINIKFNPSDNH